MPYGRCAGIAALRLPRSTGVVTAKDRRLSRWSSSLSSSGGPWYRPDEQTARIRTAGWRHGYCRSEPTLGFRRRFEGLRLLRHYPASAGSAPRPPALEQSRQGPPTRISRHKGGRTSALPATGNACRAELPAYEVNETRTSARRILIASSDSLPWQLKPAPISRLQKKELATRRQPGAQFRIDRRRKRASFPTALAEQSRDFVRWPADSPSDLAEPRAARHSAPSAPYAGRHSPVWSPFRSSIDLGAWASIGSAIPRDLLPSAPV